jgi:endonuclease/exonuclease/phosphatase family metal-dependent hydrolase
LAIGAVPPGDVVGLVRRERIDVLALQEATPALLAALDEAGLRPLLPHRVLHPAPGGAGSAVFAWFPLCAQPVISVGFAQARTLVEVPDAPPVEVVSVHPCAPVRPFLVPCWRAGLRALPRADVRGAVRVLAGDFNATLDHAALRRLTDSGYRDAADVTGDGLHGTWPVGWPTPLPRVALDHVLVDPRVVVRHTETHGLARSDHRALRADLVLPTR